MDERSRELEALYRRRYVRFRDGVATITGNRESARDVVQEAFARALRRRDTFRGESTLEVWVWKIALRTAQEQRRKTQPVALNGSIDSQLVDAARDPALTAALQALPAKRRLIVFLRYFADLSYEEIASLCGVSEGTVGATLTQARSALEALLNQEDSDERR